MRARAWRSPGGAGPDRHAGNVLPIIREIQAAGISALAGISDALNARGVRTARGAMGADDGQAHPRPGRVTATPVRVRRPE
jgi:hypothetical protein